ncbi:MAG: hypothetical protein ACSHXA_14625 [Polaribacter sp.]|uniref:hypothetical protein n=1 Tax=Polaribacter sp. TaxID=1920175 RepID=UPI003EF330EF
MNITTKKQSIVALLYFLIAAFLGIVLRLFPITNVNATYRYLVHTHSHIALLGWVYVALTALIFHICIKLEAQKKYSKVFWCTQITILGMLFSFPITGYALFSILFSSLFLICTYWFYLFFKKNTHCNKDNYSYKFIHTALLFLIFSSIGPWSLGIIMNTLGNTSHWYKNAIYFYLHFQYNGWFIFSLLGIFFFLLEKHKIQIHKQFIPSFYRFMVLSCCLTLFLSFLWIKPSNFVYILAGLGVVFQVIALGKLQQIFNHYKTNFTKIFSPFIFKLLQFIYLLFIFKILLQFISAIPYFAELTSQILDFVIGYLHLTFLGIVCLSLFVFLQAFGVLKLSKFWVLVYILGFVLSEFLIFYKGFCNWQQISMINKYYAILVAVSAIIPVGILGIFIQNLALFTNSSKKE